MSNNVSRRSFLKKSAVAAAGISIVPNVVLGKKAGHMAPSDKLNVAYVGIGGICRADLGAAKETSNVYALCDVDQSYAKKTFDENPKAKRFEDWRVMFDKIGKEIDNVLVATPDHTHAIVTATAITLGKNVYTEKPLTHSVYESRLLTNLAKKYKVATQMGNQGSSSHDMRRICECIWSGQIGEVKEVHCWTNRPIWPQGLNRPAQGEWVPETLNWDLFIGPAQMRPYHHVYTPWNWRGWWPFGTGALGDMACHIIDPAFRALELGYPTKIYGSSTQFNMDCAPTAEMVTFTFPARVSKNKNIKIKLPEVKVTWYDGGLLPPRFEKFADLPIKNRENGNGTMFVGTKDILICDTYGAKPYLASGNELKGKEILRRVPGGDGNARKAHVNDWLRASKLPNGDEKLNATYSNFTYSGPFNEMVVMGANATRLQDLDKTLLWDAQNMKFTNISDSDKIRVVESDSFEVKDGHPRFNTKRVTMAAKPFAEELVKHTYREGWTLPEMPNL